MTEAQKLRRLAAALLLVEEGMDALRHRSDCTPETDDILAAEHITVSCIADRLAFRAEQLEPMGEFNIKQVAAGLTVPVARQGVQA